MNEYSLLTCRFAPRRTQNAMSSRRFLPLLSLTPLPLYLLSPHSNCQSSPPSPSFPSILKTIRSTSTETRLRWIRDEDHWRKLPSRAWPSHQPSHNQEEKLREVYEEKCGDGRDDKKECVDVTFRLATCLVFNNLGEIEQATIMIIVLGVK